MMKYEYGFEDWSRSTDRYTIECDRKLDQDEIFFVISETESTLSDGVYNQYDDVTSKIPLDDGNLALVTYHGNELGSSDYEITRGRENLKWLNING